MRLLIRNILAPVLDENNKKKLKKWEFKLKKKLISLTPKLNEKEFRTILVNTFNLKSGDHIFIHASLSLINTNLSSSDILRILEDVVGSKGSISVPCYPAMSSKKFMLSKKKFDMNKTPSGMGGFSELVRKNEKAHRSLHPTKSIAGIGLPEGLLKGHNECDYPFGVGSPYHKLLKLNLKVLGVGVPMSYLSFVHVAEDINYNIFPLKVNEAEKLIKDCIDENGELHHVATYVHDMNMVVKANPERYVKKNVSKEFWKIKNWYLTPFFVVDANALTDSITQNIDKNITVYK
jgi:aminoglycoside 3-N-acetyltransferase